MAAHTRLVIGVDVGSTTVKATAVNPDTLEIVWAVRARPTGQHASSP